jgi:hypothetical protein
MTEEGFLLLFALFNGVMWAFTHAWGFGVLAVLAAICLLPRILDVIFGGS